MRYAAWVVRSFRLWTIWLETVFLALAVFGICLAILGPETLLGDFFRLYTRAMWDEPEIPAEAVPLSRWVFGVLGATIASWAVAMAFVVAKAFRKRELWGWWCIVLSIAVWFLLDTILSFAAGVWPNAIFNAGVLLLVAPPIIFTKKHFGQRRPDPVSGEIGGK